MERQGTGCPQRATESRKKATESRKKGTAVLGFSAVDLDGGTRVHRGTAAGGALLHVRRR